MIEPAEETQKSIFEFEDKRNALRMMQSERDIISDSSKGLSQQHRDVIRAYLQKDKSVSAADLVKYNYESSAAMSSLEDMQSSSNPSSHNLTGKLNTLSAINLVALA